MTARRFIHRGGAIATLMLMLGCTTTGAPRAAGARGADLSRAPRRVGDLITADAIAQAGMGTGSALAALARLRPELVRREYAVPGERGAPRALVLYVDGTRQGAINLLADVRAGVIAEMRYVGPAEALTWFGPGHEAGVIDVRIRKQ